MFFAVREQNSWRSVCQANHRVAERFEAASFIDRESEPQRLTAMEKPFVPSALFGACSTGGPLTLSRSTPPLEAMHLLAGCGGSVS